VSTTPTTVPSRWTGRHKHSLLLSLVAELRAQTAAAREALSAAAVRGQLGPSVGRRHDERPERFL
jgi:hypothetical protein